MKTMKIFKIKPIEKVQAIVSTHGSWILLD